MLLPEFKNNSRSWLIGFLVLLPVALFLLAGAAKLALGLEPGSQALGDALHAQRFSLAGFLFQLLVIAGPLLALALTIYPMLREELSGESWPRMRRIAASRYSVYGVLAIAVLLAIAAILISYLR